MLDPFCGSGSTLCACKQLGFDYIGVDMCEEYVEIAKQRVAAYEKNYNIFTDGD